ncbi:uncharacterized protein C9orf50 homolog [Cynocephalus volans]|uniref:uncharacterized protein C9orf50 homolog n=1 Tax=Cynocephalus volans TaxID=110931 RepID=UPI002FC72F58
MYRVPGPILSGGRVLAHVNVTATPKGGRSRSRPFPGRAGRWRPRGSPALATSDGERGALWWQEGGTEPGVGVGGPPPRLPALPALPTGTQRAARNRQGLQSLRLPPLCQPDPPRGSASPRAVPGKREDGRRGAAWEAPDPAGALRGELLHRLRERSAEPQPQTSAAQQHRRGVSEHCQGSRQCPHCSFLPDLPGQSSSFQNSLKKILLCQIPALGLLKGDHSRFTTTRKANHRPPSTQVTKAKDVLTHSSLGEGSGPRRRCCPFRVRFADESMWDTLLRYWERNCAVQQNTIKNRTVTPPTVTEQVFRNIGRWLDSLPKDLYPSNKQETMAGPSDWDCPSLPTQESQGHLSEDASMNSSLPFIPRATTQRRWGPLKTFLDTHNVLERESFLPSLMLQPVLKRGHPKAYQLLLPSLTTQRAQK